MKRCMQSEKQNQSTGFTLVEFIVIISIFAIIATVSLFNSGSFNRHTAMQNLTHDIALVIRQAQNYGMGSTASDIDANNRYPIAVQFQRDLGNNKFLSEMILFRDMNQSAQYEENNDMLLDRITFRSPSYIFTIENGNGSTCEDSDQFLTIGFQRPLPDPRIFCGSNQWNDMIVTISNNDNANQKTITVQPTGLISVD
ncbi:MAG: prepilin-type N-terminal cleavage/methylation domain-containing protein [Candidatus Pacebacteria bacterium]|nr:prepilin-type N-terminal cleavage/methylation domain-containing protein [Candidatus Paceibacterota bacterium]